MEPPTAIGSNFSCDGSTTDFGGSCNLTCDKGYTGDRTLTCNVDYGNGTAGWDDSSPCASKLMFNIFWL